MWATVVWWRCIGFIQEALTNVARHAGAAATTSASTTRRPRRVHVSNYGRQRPECRLESTGVGIIGMRERAESLGGTLTAEPTPSGGFHVTAVLPYNASKANTR